MPGRELNGGRGRRGGRGGAARAAARRRRRPSRSPSSSPSRAWSRASASGPSSTGWRSVSACAAGCATPRPGSRSTPKARGGARRVRARRARGGAAARLRRHADARGGAARGPRGLRHRRERPRPGRLPARLAGHRDLRRLPARAARPGRPPSRLPVHQLHQLRAALHDHRGAALRPRAHDDAPLPAVPRLSQGVRGPDRPALPRRAQRVPGVRPARAAGAARRSRGMRRRAGRRRRRRAGRRRAKRTRRPPIRAAAELLRAGEILAVKGLGGFHLACDATDGEVVRRLKERKRRPDKPLAVMFRDLDAAARALPRERRGGDAADLARAPDRAARVARDRGGRNGRGGAGRRQRSGAGDATVAEPSSARRTLRSTPRSPSGSGTSARCCRTRRSTSCCCAPPARPLVMTSGNLAEEPIVKGWEEADRLAHVADAYLLHDREIAARYDDSVALVRRGRPRLVRRSRGYAPFPVALPRTLPQVLACGAELKNTFCATRDAYAFLSQHIGDLENLETLEHYETSIALYERMFRLEPEVVAYDLHPEYLATKYALTLPQDEKVAVQHHHAHVAARLVEHGREDRVIGVALDGLGYGDDGVLWGGEVLVARPSRVRAGRPSRGAAAARRRARHRAPGADGGGLGVRAARRRRARAGGAAAAQPRRRARAGSRTPRPARRSSRDEELAVVARQVQTGENAPLTTSCGRLFDAVAALAGVRGSITYEGQAAIELEMMSRAGGEPYPFVIEGEVARRRAACAATSSAWRRCSAAVMDDAEAGREPGFVGSRLHATVAALTLELCRRIRAASGLCRRRPHRRRLPEPPARRPLRGRSRGRRLRGPERRPRARQRRRRRVGAGRGGGLYCPAPPRPARLRPPAAASDHRPTTGPPHVPRASHAHHRHRRPARDHRRRGPRAARQHRPRSRRRHRRLRPRARRLRDQRDRRGGGRARRTPCSPSSRKRPRGRTRATGAPRPAERSTGTGRRRTRDAAGRRCVVAGASFDASPPSSPSRRARRSSVAAPPALTFMEVCGTHTMAIARFGLRDLLPPEVRLSRGPAARSASRRWATSTRSSRSPACPR